VTLSFMDTLIGPTYLLTYLLTHLSGMGYHTVDDDVHRGMDSKTWHHSWQMISITAGHHRSCCH